MATGWVRALRCKSNAVDDVASRPISLKKPLLLPISCADSSLLPKYPSSFPKIPSAAKPRRRARASSSSTSSSRSKAKPSAFPASPMAAVAAAAEEGGAFPTLAEVAEGHSSRRVVEIIFVSSWGAAPFPGEIEMLFRVHNPARTAARFEEYREAVRARAARSGEPRCAADGNEVMRFHCGGGGGGGGAAEGIYDARVATCAVATAAAGAEGIRTFAGSGRAHESCGGGGAGRRAMLVCRVIAGRVRTESDAESEGDSVSLGKGELVVFDRRAVLPCFLIIYKINTSN